MTSKDGVRETLEKALTWEGRLNEAEQAGMQRDTATWARVKNEVRMERHEFVDALTQLEAMERDREAMEKLRSSPDSLLRHYADSDKWYFYPDTVQLAGTGDDPADAILGREQDDGTG